MFSFLLGIFTTKREIPPYTWINELHKIVSRKDVQRFDVEWVEITDNNIAIKGLPGYTEDGDYSRLPNRVTADLREPLRLLERNTAGGMATFVTDSSKLRIIADISSSKPPHMTDIMSAGLDIYVDGSYLKSFYSSVGTLDEEISIPKSRDTLVEVYFPLYGNAETISFFTEADATNTVPSSQKKTIVYYGSSITQGCCASNPAMSFPALVSRILGVEQINLGFSGNGLGDIELAEFIIELNVDAIVLDYWGNPTPEIYSKTLPLFIEAIRRGHPKVPILVTSTFANPGREVVQKLKDEISIATVNTFKDAGDKNIYFVDGLLNENEIDGLIDGRHPNSYGFSLVANRLSEVIEAKGLLQLH